MHGKKLVFNCGTCERQVEDYASNRRDGKTKSGMLFCSVKCAGEGRRRILSLANGGDGELRTKQERDARHYRNNADHVRGRMNAYYDKYRLSIIDKRKTADRALKQEIIDAFGGKCRCCGETAFEFLTIDHINGDGAAHRREIGGKGRRLYRAIKAEGFPKKRYRLLCLNCNITLGFYGYCPHHPTRRAKGISHVPFNPGRKRTVP